MVRLHDNLSTNNYQIAEEAAPTNPAEKLYQLCLQDDTQAIEDFLAQITDTNCLISNINFRDKIGRDALFIACSQKNSASALLLLNHPLAQHYLHMDIVDDEYGNSLLHIACAASDLQLIIELLNRGFSPGLENRYGFTPIYSAVCNGRYKTVSYLLGLDEAAHRSCLQGNNLLHYALNIDEISQDTLETVKVLVEGGVDLHQQNQDSRTPLYYVGGDEPMNVEITEYLLAQGARLNVQDCKGNTPLHWACARGDIEIVKIMLDYNPDLSVQNNNNHTAYDITKLKNYSDITGIFKAKEVTNASLEESRSGSDFASSLLHKEHYRFG